MRLLIGFWVVIGFWIGLLVLLYIESTRPECSASMNGVQWEECLAKPRSPRCFGC
jgi:hypothetical protein